MWLVSELHISWYGRMFTVLWGWMIFCFLHPNDISTMSQQCFTCELSHSVCVHVSMCSSQFAGSQGLLQCGKGLGERRTQHVLDVTHQNERHVRLQEDSIEGTTNCKLPLSCGQSYHPCNSPHQHNTNWDWINYN